MTSVSEREAELKAKRICRFCLSQTKEELSSIYSRDIIHHIQSNAPLPVQVMACVSMEVFSNDGMPIYICNECRLLFNHGYRFKQMCKRAETLLRQFPLTGKWPSALAKPSIPGQQLPKHTTAAKSVAINVPAVSAATKSKQTPTQRMSLPTMHTSAIRGKAATAPKKLLNSNPVDSPEPPAPMRMKKLADETAIFLNKFENDEELSIEDVQRLIAATEKDEEFLVGKPSPLPEAKKRPKELNKSSIRILNKEAENVLEPRLTKPQVKRDKEGNLAVVTAVIDPSQVYEVEPDPIKSAQPIETNVFPCPHCDRSFPLLQLREIHMTQHIRERSFQCPECDKSFFSKYDLQKHALTHTGVRPFKCSVCDKTFTRFNLQYRHEKTHTDIPKFICIYCEKPFITREQMDKHAERHLKKRPWTCKICSKAFAFKQGLERHEVVHLRQQPYPCQYCEQSFSTPSKLSRHLTAHAGRRPFPCKYCTKSYLLSHHLTRHLRSHVQVVSHFTCAECFKQYKTREELVYHSAVHSKETLCCPLCKDVLEDVNMVKDHIKAHAEGDTFACEFCDLIFMTSERLQQHIAATHIEEMIPYNEDEKNQIDNGLKAQEQHVENIGEVLWEQLDADAVQLMDFDDIESSDIINVTQEDIAFKSKVIAVESILDKPEATSEITIKLEDTEHHSPPPAKNRKICASSTAALGQTVQRRAVGATKAEVCAEARRKTSVTRGTNQATTSQSKASLARTPSSSKVKLHIEENILVVPATNKPTNTMLKGLPKCVSVRKRTPTATAVVASDTTTTKASPVASTSQPKATIESKTSPRVETQKRVLRGTPIRASETAAGGHDESSAQTILPHNKQLAVKQTPVSKAANASATTSDNQSGEKVVKMMFGDKKVKVQKISISRAEADAMTRDGRIHIKDGNMILTRVLTTKPSK